MLSLRILEIVFPIFSIVLFGWWYGIRFKPDMTVANRLNMDIFVPALIFSVIVGQSVDIRSYVPLLLGALAVVIGSGMLTWLIAKPLRIEVKTLAPPMMFSNTGNMGLPLIVLAFGESALPAAVMVLLLNMMLHFSLGTYLLNNKTNIIRVLVSPLIIVNTIALIISGVGWKIDTTVLLPIKMVGGICIPLMLFALGVRLADASLAEWKIGLLGAILAPVTGIAIAFLVLPILELNNTEKGVLFLFATLPPAVLNFIFAERYQQEPAKVASIVIIGNVFGLISIPLALAYVLPRFS